MILSLRNKKKESPKGDSLKNILNGVSRRDSIFMIDYQNLIYIAITNPSTSIIIAILALDN